MLGARWRSAGPTVQGTQRLARGDNRPPGVRLSRLKIVGRAAFCIRAVGPLKYWLQRNEQIEFAKTRRNGSVGDRYGSVLNVTFCSEHCWHGNLHPDHRCPRRAASHLRAREHSTRAEGSLQSIRRNEQVQANLGYAHEVVRMRWDITAMMARRSRHLAIIAVQRFGASSAVLSHDRAGHILSEDQENCSSETL